MKKLVFVLVLFMAVLAVNAQVKPDSKTPDSKTPPTTMPSNSNLPSNSNSTLPDNSNSTLPSNSTMPSNSNSTIKDEIPTRAAVVTSDLQKPITDNIAKDFAGYTVKDASSVTTNGTVTYEVVVAKGTSTETLVYDKDGKFVKKLQAASGTDKK